MLKTFKHQKRSLNVQLDSDLLDNINLKIIDFLSKDSSTPFVEIAKQIGISDATVHIRVRRLLAAGIINKFTISVDNNRLGYDHLAFMGINVEPGLQKSLPMSYQKLTKYWKFTKCMADLICF